MKKEMALSEKSAPRSRGTAKPKTAPKSAPKSGPRSGAAKKALVNKSSAKAEVAKKRVAKPGIPKIAAPKAVALKKSNPVPAKPVASSAARETLKVILAQLEDMQAQDTVTIDLEAGSSIADYVIVTTGRSNRHVGSVADRVVEGLHKIKVKTKVEGMTNCDWVLIDAGDVIVHVFRPEVRTFYNLEKMWTGVANLRPAN
jgi:ribosome-associated protein